MRVAVIAIRIADFPTGGLTKRQGNGTIMIFASKLVGTGRCSGDLERIAIKTSMNSGVCQTLVLRHSRREDREATA